MKQAVITISLAILFVLLAQQIGHCSTVVLDSRSWQEKELCKRQPIFDDLLNQFGDIAQKTDDSGMKVIEQFLRLDTALVYPVCNDGFKTIPLDKRSHRVRVLILLPEDKVIIRKCFGEEQEKLQGAMAVYFPNETPLIVVGEKPLGSPWKEMTLFRAGITIAEIKAGADSSSDTDSQLWERAKIENSVWESIAEVMIALKGSAFQNLVDREAERLNSQDLMLRPPAGLYSRALDLLFGKALSPFEEKFRQTVLWISAAIKVINERNPEALKAQEERTKFLYKIYKTP